MSVCYVPSEGGGDVVSAGLTVLNLKIRWEKVKAQYTDNSKISLPHSHNNTPLNPKKWITFTYHNPMIRNFTDLFKNTNIKITFHTNNTNCDVLKTHINNTNTYMCSGIYQLSATSLIQVKLVDI